MNNGKYRQAARPQRRGEASTGTPAEPVERRPVAKGNPDETTADGTQRPTDASSDLVRVREAAQRDATQRFTTLLHHVTPDLLRQSYTALKHEAAAGVDEVTWQDYGRGLEEHLEDLHRRIHTGRYRAQPSKRIWLAKADGTQRPIGIAALEDKIVQKALVSILEQIYEADFLGFSYGFRPRRGPHDALDAIYVAITRGKVNWVLDADLRSFFDTLSHTWLLKFVEHRIADPRILRLLRKILRAGVSEDGQWSRTEVGVPQGAVISPLLANIYLHYVLDLWAHRWRSRKARGEVYIVRYADDFVIGFQYDSDAKRFAKDLEERLAQFALSLHEEKTRLIEFGRFAETDRKKRGGGKPETFDFLGFTHYCTRTRKTGAFALGRKTIAKRMRGKLKMVRGTLRRMWQQPVERQGKWLGAVLRGYYNYYGVPGNTHRLGVFRQEISKAWLRILRRRSQKGRRLKWSRFATWTERWLPKVRVTQPYPDKRLRVRPKARAV